MLKLINNSRASKTTGCAVTYRSGVFSPFATCPATCSLNPYPQLGTQAIDWPYLSNLIAAVPPGGYAWTYTHFQAVNWAGFVEQAREIWRDSGQRRHTVINASVETVTEARQALALSVPVVLALPKEQAAKVWHLRDASGRRRRVVRCPAQYQPGVTCRTCGGIDGPLCARDDRDYLIAFYGHGSTAKAVGQATPGGCYAANGNVRLQWDATWRSAMAALARRQPTSREDGIRLRQWAQSLPARTVLRHHVAGDIGKEIGA